MNRLRLFTYSLLFVAAATRSASQPRDLKFEHLTHEEGLSQSTVNAIVQDGQGFMWFGTQDGLNRYDGYSVVVHRHRQSDTNAISDNAIWSLCRDRSGDIWIGTMRGGLNRYMIAEDRFLHYVNNPADTTSLADNNVSAVFQDSRGLLWVGTMNNGLNCLDPQTGRFTRFRSVPDDASTLSDNTVWSVSEGHAGELWIATWKGLCRMDLPSGNPAGAVFTRFMFSPGTKGGISGPNVRVVFVDSQDRLWVGTWGSGLDLYDRARGSFEHFRHEQGNASSLSSDLVLSLHEDARGNLWVGTGDHGLNLFLPASHTFKQFASDPRNPKALNNDIICSVYSDRWGSLWIGTGAGGVNWYDALKNRFPHYRHDENANDDLSGNDVWAITEDRAGELWVGTYGNGLTRIDRKRQHYTMYTSSRSGLSHDNVLSLCESRDGSIWIGTEGGGLNCYDKGTGRFEHFRNNPADTNSLGQNEVTCILEDQEGFLWIGTNGDRLDRFDRTGRKFHHYRLGEGLAGPSGTAVMALYEDASGVLWVGTLAGGINRYNRSTETFTHFSHSPDSLGGLNNNTVLSIYEDADRRLWLGTYGGGLNCFDLAANTVSYLTETDGLPNNVVYGILPDDHGNLWLSTNKGLSRFSPGTRTFRNYDVKDGLQGNEFNQGSHFRSPRGELFVGGINGFNAFFPDSIHDNPHIPPVVLTSFKVFDRPIVLNESVTSVRSIGLSYEQNFFSFEFVALNYTSPDKNRYAYMLEGLDPDWVLAGTRRYASYTNLDPGGYTLRVKGSNNDGLWNEEGIAVSIVIVPPYWRTWWFRTLVMLSVATVLFLMYRYRVRKLLEIERIRASIATDLHDDIGSTLTEIALFSDVGLREVRSNATHKGDTDLQKISALLEDIGHTSRGLIDAMNDIVWSIDPKNDSFDFLLLRMKSHASRIMEAKGINYEIAIPEELSALKLPLGFRRRFFLIFKEAINNIIRHAHPTKVLLTVQREADLLVLSIADNGTGFNPAVPGTGNGLRNMQERAAALNGSLSISSSEGRGTTITLRAAIP